MWCIPPICINECCKSAVAPSFSNNRRCDKLLVLAEKIVKHEICLPGNLFSVLRNTAIQNAKVMYRPYLHEARLDPLVWRSVRSPRRRAGRWIAVSQPPSCIMNKRRDRLLACCCFFTLFRLVLIAICEPGVFSRRVEARSSLR